MPELQMTTETFIAKFEETVAEMVKVMRKKNSDYADSDSGDPFRNFMLVERLGVTDVETGILVRMCDKVSRIATLNAKEKRGEDRRVLDESIDDTLLDLANYAIILRLARIARTPTTPTKS